MTPKTVNPNKPKILLAEDNPVVSKGVANFLAKWGYNAILADNGDAAWDALEKDHSIRLAIVDWNLPGLSGIQICQRLRTRMGPYVYTIMFSARKSYEEKIIALDGGADEYLVKPCKPSELRARLGVGRRIVETAMNNFSATTSCPPPASKKETGTAEKTHPPESVDFTDSDKKDDTQKK